tara:strand:+ start:644 stop:1072 length:429 start_codon:yes stop_codon:yes gene_type:complete
MKNEPVDIGTPYVTREDMQDSIDRLSIKIDDLEKGKITNLINTINDLEKSDLQASYRFRQDQMNDLMNRIDTTDKLLKQVWSKKDEMDAVVSEINDLYQRVDELHQAQYDANERLSDMQKSLTLFIHLVSDKLGIKQGEKNG